MINGTRVNIGADVFSVKFPNGVVIQGNTQFDTFCLVLKEIGVERASQFALSTDKLRRYGSPYVGTQIYAKIKNTSGYSYERCDGFYVIKGLSAPNMGRFLRYLSEYYNLKLEINIPGDR